MSNTKKSINLSTKTPAQKTVDVMYQNLNGVWYAFATIGDEIYVGKLPQNAPKNGDLSKIQMKKAGKASDYDSVL